MVKHQKNRNTKKYRKNKRIRKTQRLKYEMKPIYGGGIFKSISDVKNKYIVNPINDNIINPVKTKFNETAQRLDEEKKLNTTIMEKLKNRNTSDWAKSTGIGVARKTSDIMNIMQGNPSSSRYRRPPPKNIVDISKTASNIFSGISSAFSSSKDSNKTTTNTSSSIITPSEKQKVKEKLHELQKSGQITLTEYQHAVQQLDKPDGVLGMGNSIVSIMSPIQSMVKVIGDWFIRPPDVDEINGRQTVVKLLKFPSSAKKFVKGSLGNNGKELPELDEYMIIVNDAHNTASDKISADLLGVDNLLANIINGCIGAGCKDGKVHQDPGFEKVIEIVDNQEKKKLVEEMKRNREKELEEEAMKSQIDSENNSVKQVVRYQTR